MIAKMGDTSPPPSIDPTGGNALPRTLSITSVESTQSFESDELEEDLNYDTAPDDLFYETAQLGKILVLKKGDAVPCITRFKRTKKGGLTALRFRFFLVVRNKP